MMQGYQIYIEYIPGKEIILADAQSRFRISKIKETFDPEVKIDLVKFSNKHLIEIINERRFSNQSVTQMYIIVMSRFNHRIIISNVFQLII